MVSYSPVCVKTFVWRIDFEQNITFFPQNGNTALMFECQYGDLAMVKMLVEHGARIDHHNKVNMYMYIFTLFINMMSSYHIIISMDQQLLCVQASMATVTLWKYC